MDLYEAIYSRRDVRHFRTDPVPEDVLLRILDAAHHAGSVGFMQPWNFVVIRRPETKQRVHDLFALANVDAAENYSGDRRKLYDSLRLEGIREAALNIAVTCDRTRGGAHVLGRNSIPETDLYSTCCAVQNLWLAARAEGLGVGWVSILDPVAVKELLGIPQEIVLVAYLCVGYPVKFEERPLLETAGWESRRPLAETLFAESWQNPWPLHAR